VSDGFLEGLRSLTSKHGALLILDELRRVRRAK
jgi:glutamate-1-semialdehyde aminotransferase